MRKWLVLFLLLTLLAFPSTAGAQGGIKLKSINIELWSEYDRPSMLVIHEFTVNESVPLPVDVKVRFPSEGNLIAVAYTADTLINTSYEGPEAQGDWQIVTIRVESYAPHRIEYYQPFKREDSKRSFYFRWFGDYAVDQFSVTTQIPADSTEVVTDPPFSSTVQSTDGLHLVGIASRDNLRMGQSYEFKIEYRRDSDLVTKPGNTSNVQPAAPIDSNTEGRVSIDNLPWIIGGFGLALIGLALFFYWRSTQVPERKPRQRRRSGNNEEEGEGQAYCHECGTRAHAGDRFCRTCGSRLRV